MILLQWMNSRCRSSLFLTIPLEEALQGLEKSILALSSIRRYFPSSRSEFQPLISFGYVIPSESGDPNALDWGFALEYSLPYLQEHVQEVEWLRPFRNVIPLVEFAMNSPLDRDGGQTTGTINPGIPAGC